MDGHRPRGAGRTPAAGGAVSHEPEPSAEHPVKGRSPGADLITAIASRIFHWHVRHGVCPQSFRLWCGDFLWNAVIVWTTPMPAADVEKIREQFIDQETFVAGGKATQPLAIVDSDLTKT
jgi:hypothetical protein